jgi:hypothetical protein
MESDSDLPHQPDSHDQLSQMETKGNLSWKALFILIVAVNLIFFYYAGTALNQTAGGVSGIGILPFLFLLAVIDFLAAFFYIRKQHPHGIARVISYIVLILITLYLVQMAFGIILIMLPMSFRSF